MTELFISLYLDQDVDILLAQLLRARGFDVQTTLEAGKLGAPDHDQIGYAASTGRAFFTHNRVDAENLAAEYAAAGTSHHGIIIAVRRPVYELRRRALILLDAVAADEIVDQIRYI